MHETVLRALGGPAALNLRRVTVTGRWTSGIAAGPMPSLRADAIQVEPTAAFAQPATGAARPFVTLLCRFADSPGVPHGPEYY